MSVFGDIGRALERILDAAGIPPAPTDADLRAAELQEIREDDWTQERNARSEAFWTDVNYLD